MSADLTLSLDSVFQKLEASATRLETKTRILERLATPEMGCAIVTFGGSPLQYLSVSGLAVAADVLGLGTHLDLVGVEVEYWLKRNRAYERWPLFEAIMRGSIVQSVTKWAGEPLYTRGFLLAPDVGAQVILNYYRIQAMFERVAEQGGVLIDGKPYAKKQQ